MMTNESDFDSMLIYQYHYWKESARQSDYAEEEDQDSSQDYQNHREVAAAFLVVLYRFLELFVRFLEVVFGFLVGLDDLLYADHVAVR